MKYAIQMVSGGMISIPGFIKPGSGIQRLIRGTHRHTDITVIVQAYFRFFKTRYVG
jgi:hypothetical protein